MRPSNPAGSRSEDDGVGGPALTFDGDWSNRSVFLTGHTGFKGSWLTLQLAARGARVHGYALAPERPSLYEQARVEEATASSTLADVRDLVALTHALLRSRPEVVVHMAAQPLVRLSYEQPLETYAVNVMGTANLLEAVRRCSSVRAVVVVTSDKCYENREWVWGYREDEPMGGHDPYSSSKGCAEILTAAWRRSYFREPDAPRIATARAGNVIGGGDWALDRLVPDLMRAFAAGRETLMRNPGAIRPWQHVLEPLSGYVRLAEALLADEGRGYAEAWNFGPAPEAERTVLDVVRAAAGEWGPSAAWRLDSGPHPHEAGFLKLDSSKSKFRLGWRPAWSFDTAVRETVGWYLRHAEGADMRDFTLSQIAEYEAVAAAESVSA